MKTMLMISAAMLLTAAATPAFAQSDAIQSRPPTQTPGLPGGTVTDTHEPDKPGGEDGSGEPTPGGDGGGGPASGDFDPGEVQFPAQSTSGGQLPVRSGYTISPNTQGGISMEEEDDQPSITNPNIGRQPNAAGNTRVCCHGFYGGTQWSTREACLGGGGDLAPDNACQADANAGGERLPVYQGYEIVPLSPGNEDTRSGETVDGEPVRRRQRVRDARDDGN